MWALLSNYLSGSFHTLMVFSQQSCKQRRPSVRKPLPNQLQVIHSRGDHWILASNIGCANGDVNVYDSVYRSVDKATIAVITQLFQSSAVKIVKSRKQKGVTDCGVFAIATATAFAHGILNLSSFDQSAMRRHLVNCFKEHLMTPFPCS